MTKETVFKVLSAYWGFPFRIKVKGVIQAVPGKLDIHGLKTIDDFLGNEVFNKDKEKVFDKDSVKFCVIIKPLAEITEEHATAVAKIGLTHADYIKEIIKNKTDWQLRGEMIDALRQFGYDTRHYLLDGKNLYESGLAIYENGN